MASRRKVKRDFWSDSFYWNWEEAVYRAKLNKPSGDWKTSEWDRVVDLVVAAMREPPRDRP